MNLKIIPKNLTYISLFYFGLYLFTLSKGLIILTDTDSLFNHYPNVISGALSSCKQEFIFSMFGGVSKNDVFHWHTNYFPYNLFCFLPNNLILDGINLWIVLCTFFSHIFLYLTSIKVTKNKLYSLVISSSFIFSGCFWFLTTSFIAFYQFLALVLGCFL